MHVGAIYRDWGGFHENQNPAGTELNRQRTTAFNGLLRWTPSDRFDVNLRANYAEDDDTTAAAFLVPLNIAPTLSKRRLAGLLRGRGAEPPGGRQQVLHRIGQRGRISARDAALRAHHGLRCDGRHPHHLDHGSHCRGSAL
jgi:hypothetical protein